MSEKAFDIQEYMTHGVERVVKEAIKATLKNPKESVFMAKFAAASKAAGKKRRKAEDAGEHIPPLPHRQHHQPVQPALRGLLFPLQPRHGGHGTGEAIDQRRMAAHL